MTWRASLHGRKGWEVIEAPTYRELCAEIENGSGLYGPVDVTSPEGTKFTFSGEVFGIPHVNDRPREYDLIEEGEE